MTDINSVEEWMVIEKTDDGVVNIHIISEIGAFSSDSFNTILNRLSDAKSIHVYINSPGGSIFTGFSLLDLLREKIANGVNVEAIITGLCASMASVVAFACNKIYMYPESMIMIHNPTVLIDGDADYLRNIADVLDEIKEKIIDIYQSKFNFSKDEIEKMMDNETWLSSDDAKKYGIAEIIEEDVKAVAKWKIEHLKCFKLVPYNLIAKRLHGIKKSSDEFERLSALCKELRMSIEKRDELIRDLQSKCDKLSVQLDRAKAAIEIGLEFHGDDREITWSEAVSMYGYAEARKKYPELWEKELKN